MQHQILAFSFEHAHVRVYKFTHSESTLAVMSSGASSIMPFSSWVAIASSSAELPAQNGSTLLTRDQHNSTQLQHGQQQHVLSCLQQARSLICAKEILQQESTERSTLSVQERSKEESIKKNALSHATLSESILKQHNLKQLELMEKQQHLLLRQQHLLNSLRSGQELSMEKHTQQQLSDVQEQQADVLHKQLLLHLHFTRNVN